MKVTDKNTQLLSRLRNAGVLLLSQHSLLSSTDLLFVFRTRSDFFRKILVNCGPICFRFVSNSDELVFSLYGLWSSVEGIVEFIRVNAETWWFSEFSRSMRDLSESTKERLWVICSKVSVLQLNSNCFLLPLNLISDLSFLTKDEDDLSWSSESSRFKCENFSSK